MKTLYKKSIFKLFDFKFEKKCDTLQYMFFHLFICVFIIFIYGFSTI